MIEKQYQSSRWWITLGAGLSLAIIFIDQTGLAVALPSIQQALTLSNTATQWIMNAYLLAIGSCILLGGKLGDNHGHRFIFLIGIVTFILSSILCGFAPNGFSLIGGRVLQGIGGSFMLPSLTGIIFAAFPDHERGKAIGIYAGVGGLFLAMGPMIGGLLTQWFGWHAIFFANIPIGIVSIFLLLRFVPTAEKKQRVSLDWVGFLLTSLFVCCLVLGLMEGPSWGWGSIATLSLFSLSLLSIFIYFFWEKRLQNPLVELSLFKNKDFLVGSILIFFLQMVSVVFVFWAIFFQTVLKKSPEAAGFLLLPATIPIIIMSPLGGYIRDKYGNFISPLLGSLCLSIGLLVIAILAPTHNYYYLLPGLILYGIGYPTVMGGLSVFTLRSIYATKRGMASAITNCGRQLGSTIGLATFVSLSSSINQATLMPVLHSLGHSFSKIPVATWDKLVTKSANNIQILFPASSVEILKVKQAAMHAYSLSFSSTMYLGASLGLFVFILIFSFRSTLRSNPSVS